MGNLVLGQVSYMFAHFITFLIYWFAELAFTSELLGAMRKMGCFEKVVMNSKEAHCLSCTP